MRMSESVVERGRRGHSELQTELNTFFGGPNLYINLSLDECLLNILTLKLMSDRYYYNFYVAVIHPS